MTDGVRASTADQLRSSGLRVTRPRSTVLEVLLDARETHQHLDARTATARARERGVTMSTQAGYDVLDALVAAGLARRIRPLGAGAAVYESRVGDNHHHAVCRGCGETFDVDCAVGQAPCLVPLAPSMPDGFVLDEAEVLLWGRCAPCTTTDHPGAAVAPGTSTTPPASKESS